MIANTAAAHKVKRVRKGVRQPVEIQEKRFGYFPRRFRCRGKVHEVLKVERCWTIMKPSATLCFRVHCAEGSFDLFQDVRSNIWEVARI